MSIVADNKIEENLILGFKVHIKRLLVMVRRKRFWDQGGSTGIYIYTSVLAYLLRLHKLQVHNNTYKFPFFI